MHAYKPLRGDALHQRISALVGCERRVTAELLARLVEVESDQLHLRMGYDSLLAYLMGEFHFSEDAARNRVQASHVIARFPVLLDAIVDGRLHMTAVKQLAPALTPDNVEQLVEAATHKTKVEIDRLLAPPVEEAELRFSSQVVVAQGPLEEGCVPERMPSPPARAPERTPARRVEFWLDDDAQEDLRAIQALLASNPSGAAARAFKIARAELEKQKFAAVARPRAPRPSSRARTIPAHVKRAVFERDGQRCAYVGESGHRCTSTKKLEFDHIVPVAKGGRSTVDNVRLVCRRHNQYAADQTFGRTFMAKKRATQVVIKALRRLGVEAREAKDFAELTDASATVRERLREALRSASSARAPSGAARP